MNLDTISFIIFNIIIAIIWYNTGFKVGKRSIGVKDKPTQPKPNIDGVLKAMISDNKIPRSKCNIEQAQRVAWRIVKDWVEAQMAIVEAQLADLAEVFLPYAITKNGTTLYKEIQTNGMLMLQQ